MPGTSNRYDDARPKRHTSATNSKNRRGRDSVGAPRSQRASASSQKQSSRTQRASTQMTRSQNSRTQNSQTQNARQGRRGTQTSPQTQRRSQTQKRSATQNHSQAQKRSQVQSRPQAQSRSQAKKSTNIQTSPHSHVRANRSSSATKAPTRNQNAPKPKQFDSFNSPRIISTNKNKSVSSFLADMWADHRGICIAAVIVLILLVFSIVDSISYSTRIYPGVHIGDVDVSEMTVEEANAAVSERYYEALASRSAYFFASEEDANATDLTSGQFTAADGSVLSFEDAASQSLLWVENANNTGAALALDKMSEDALTVGKNWRFWERLGALFFSHTVSLDLTFDANAISELENSINAAIGTAMVNYGMSIEDGVASVVSGNDGYMVNSAYLESELKQAFLNEQSESSAFVASPENVSTQIDEAAATATCTFVNNAITNGASFSGNGTTAQADRATLGSWIYTEVCETSNGFYYLNPKLDANKATTSLVSLLNFSESFEHVPVSFSIDESGEAQVNLKQETLLPNTIESIDKLDTALFATYRNYAETTESYKENIAEIENMQPSNEVFGIEVTTSSQTGPFSLNDALTFGIVSEIATYTTTFYSSESTANRDHNIRLAASLIDNSIIYADGGSWSWIETAGACEEDDGFLAAGTINEDEYRQEPGGGICQVATTVFNSVYEAGYRITERHNHTLYMSNYPDGRDAAVSYPDLDLCWQNDTSSDVLLKTYSGDGSLTVTLYGQDPNYSVQSEVGDWEEGEKYGYEVLNEEEWLDSTSYYIKTEGVDGSSITVWRYVYDTEGNVIYTNQFVSNYQPVTEEIVTSVNTELKTDELIDKIKALEGRDSEDDENKES